MCDDRGSMAWINGPMTFLDTAESNMSAKGFMCCPCRICQNDKEYSKRNTMYSCTYNEGFMVSYYLWAKHGEPEVLMGPDEEEDDIPN